jgi:hypothetical protein
VARAVSRGATVGALLAATVAGVAWILGESPGLWLALFAVPAVVVAAVGAVRSRPSLAGAALMLDEAAETRERFLASLSAEDPEVRTLVARQAVESPSVADGRFPLTFPPSVEGLAATVSLALLAGLLLLLPAPEGNTPAADRPRAPGVASSAASGAADPGPVAPVAPVPDAARAANRAVETVAEGGDLSEEDWKALRAAGVTEEERKAAEASLAEGESEAAAAALRAAIERARRAAADPETARARTWNRYEAALDAPGWSPRFDGVVREYFTESDRLGLR